jgi:hypothetical protein
MKFPRLARLLASILIPPDREPDFVIGDHYMDRWWLIPRNKLANIYLHHIRHSDDDRALHDHPWWSISLCLRGRMKEMTTEGLRDVTAGDIVIRRATHAHRLIIEDEDCWTLFITGPIVRQWGFHCPQGWRHWKEYVAPMEKGQIGRGCEA